MNNRQLQYFIDVAECGSFTKAEELVSLSKQALKNQIDALEQELGFPLMNRNSQGITLTPAGNLFLASARRILDTMWNEIDYIQAKLNKTTISVAVSASMPTHFITACADHFSSLNSNSIVRRVPLPETDWLDAVCSDRCDLCLCSQDIAAAHDLCYTPITQISPYCLLISHDPLAQKDTLHPEDIFSRRLYVHDRLLQCEFYEYLKDKKLFFPIEEIWHKYKVVLLRCASGGILISDQWDAPNYAPLVARKLESVPLISRGFAHKAEISESVREFIQASQSLFGTEREPVI